jgi:molybdate transport system substrate-binding protein
MRHRRRAVLALIVAMAAPGAAPAVAASVHVAVAANFTAVAEAIGAKFTAQTGNDVVFSFGATGALYIQITQGAPFEVFLSADDRRTAMAIENGFGVAGTEFTYALGKLVLYAPTLDVTDGEVVLMANGFQHIALADPRSAPYGAAAMAVLDRLGVTGAVTAKIATGENITQTLQFVESGSAELGFVALSQVIGRPAHEVWPVPERYYAPIRQNAVLLKPGAGSEAARAFLGYLKGDAALALIEAAATLGASRRQSFFRVAAPLARTGFVTGLILTFAHTVGEFGVVLMIGGNIPGRTKVLSIAIYDLVERGEWVTAHWLSLAMVVFAFVVVTATMLLDRRFGRLTG